jgi:hypothetical protein
MARSRPSVVTREWGATGVGKYFPPRLSPARRKRIADELRSWDLNLQNLDSLVEDLAAAIGRYDSLRHMRNTSRPAAVRGNLQAALNAAEKLKERLNGLDGNSWLLIDKAGIRDSLSLLDHLHPIVQTLFKASRLAHQYTVRGNLSENERLFLAADVLHVLRKHLGVSSGRALEQGCFEAILNVVLEEAFRKSRRDIEGIAQSLVDQAFPAERAVSSDRKIRLEHPDGTVEYQRPQRRKTDT